MLIALLDRYDFATYDYGRTITFKLYQEDESTQFNATGYTPIIKIFETEWGRKRAGDYAYTTGYAYSGSGQLTGLGYFSSELSQVISDITGSWTSQSTGVGTFVLDSNRRWSAPGEYYVAIVLVNSTTNPSYIESTRHIRVRVWGSPGYTP